MRCDASSFVTSIRKIRDQESIAPNLLATREELETLAIRRHSVDTLDLPVRRGWRRRMIGENLLSLLDGRKHLRLENGNRVVIDEG